MDLDTIVTAVENTLREFLDEQNKDTVLAELCRPLREPQRFKVGFKNKLALAHGETSGPEVRRNLAPEHGTIYVKMLVERLHRYSEQIRRNKAVSATYQTPRFQPEQAREFAREALEESFRQYEKVGVYVLCER